MSVVQKIRDLLFSLAVVAAPAAAQAETKAEAAPAEKAEAQTKAAKKAQAPKKQKSKKQAVPASEESDITKCRQIAEQAVSAVKSPFNTSELQILCLNKLKEENIVKNPETAKPVVQGTLIDPYAQPAAQRQAQAPQPAPVAPQSAPAPVQQPRVIYVPQPQIVVVPRPQPVCYTQPGQCWTTSLRDQWGRVFERRQCSRPRLVCETPNGYGYDVGGYPQNGLYAPLPPQPALEAPIIPSFREAQENARRRQRLGH